MTYFLCHCGTPSLQNWMNPYTPETGKGCSCCPQRSLPCPCETAWCQPAQTLWPPSELGRVERLSVETPRWCKTRRFASSNWGRHPRRLSRWNSRHERGGASCSGAPPPEFAGHGWYCSKAGWRQRAQRNLLMWHTRRWNWLLHTIILKFQLSHLKNISILSINVKQPTQTKYTWRYF